MSEPVCPKCSYERDEFAWGCAICRTRFRDRMRQLEDVPLVWVQRDIAADVVTITPEHEE